jgi:transcriptional regulator with XRE-family HTH domain
VTDSPTDRDLAHVLGAVIAERRKAAGLTQVRLAELLEMADVRNLKRIERAEVQCHPETLTRIARLLGTQGWVLLKAAEERLDGAA